MYNLSKINNIHLTCSNFIASFLLIFLTLQCTAPVMNPDPGGEPPPPPQPPSFIQAIPSDNEITLIWGTPSDTNALSNFTLTWSNGSAMGETNVMPPLANASHSYTITGTGADQSTDLVVDTEYTLSVKANYTNNTNNTNVASTNATTTTPDFKVLYDVSDSMFISNAEHLGIQQGSRAIPDDWTTSWTIGGQTYTNHHTASFTTNSITVYLTYSNLPNRAQFNADFTEITNNYLLVWSFNIAGGDYTPYLNDTDNLRRFGNSLHGNAARITSEDTLAGQLNGNLSIWLNPDYSPAPTGQPMTNNNGDTYSAPASNVTLKIKSHILPSQHGGIQIEGDLAIDNPSLIEAISTGNINEVFSHTYATPYIEVGSGKTVPAPEQRGAYRLTLRFGSGAERTVYVKVQE